MKNPESTRISSLDGLRGIAALVVLFSHNLLTIPAFAAASYGQLVPPAAAWMVYTPIHVVWAGGEAVFVFFILSGFVLTLPVVRKSKFSYRAYYPARIVRLYLPVLASLAIAVALALLVPRIPRAGESAWMAVHIEALTPSTVAKDAVLVFGTDNLSSPLWSLQWEVLFSLLLPLYVLFAVKLQRLWWLTTPIVLLWIAFGYVVNHVDLVYLPMFLLGSILATQLDRLRAVGSKLYLAPRSSLIWWSLFILAIIGVTAFWWSAPYLSGAPLRATELLVVASCVLLVALSITWKAAGVFLNLRVVQWLGRISFSLYLTHEPLVVSTAQLLPVGYSWITPFIAIPVALLVAQVFYALVELPSHRAAKLLSAKITRKNPNVIVDSKKIAESSATG